MNGAASSENRKIIAVLKLILLMLIIAGIPAFLYFRYGGDIFSKDAAYRVIEYLRANRNVAAILIICIQIVQVVICFLPGQPIQFAASYMFGVARGFIFSLIGAVIGTVISFYLAKLLGSDAMELFFGKEKVRDYKKKLDSGRGLLLNIEYALQAVPSCRDRGKDAGNARESVARTFLWETGLPLDDHHIRHRCRDPSHMLYKARYTYRLP